MKRLFATILAILYLFTTTGASMHIHYCMGKFADLSMWDLNEKKTCGKCGMDKEKESDNGCCKDEHKWIKVDDDQKVITLSQQLLPDLSETPAEQFQNDFNLISSDIINYRPLSHGPPRSGSIAIYKRNCVFRI